VPLPGSATRATLRSSAVMSAPPRVSNATWAVVPGSRCAASVAVTPARSRTFEKSTMPATITPGCRYSPTSASTTSTVPVNGACTVASVRACSALASWTTARACAAWARS
jgi:hypothetical protein